VPPGEKPGIYKISGEIEGRTIKYNGLSDLYPLPDFTAEKGYIYNFIFDGNSVEQMPEEKI
jgi:hypothetical protein